MLAQRRSVWSARSRSHRRYGRQPCRIGAVQRIFGRQLRPVSCRSDRGAAEDGAAIPGLDGQAAGLGAPHAV